MADNFFKIHKGVTLAPQASEPTNPTNGDIYYDTSLNRFRKYENGSWQDLASGGGSGRINYLTNPDAENNSTSGWNTYDDGTQTPVDGTGGSPNAVTISTTSSSLRDDFSFNFTESNGADAQGQGWSTDFTIDSADINSTLQVSFLYKVINPASNGYESNDWRVYVYDIDNATLLGAVSNDEDGFILDSPDKTSTFLGQFQTTDSLNYRLLIHVDNSTLPSFNSTLITDEFFVGPVDRQIFTTMTDWESFTPTFNNLGGWTFSINAARKRRVGDTLHMKLDISVDGTGSGTSNIELVNPESGTTFAGQGIAGFYGIFDWQNNNAHYTQHLNVNSSTNVITFVNPTASGSLTANDLTASATLDVDINIGIQEWTSGNVVSNTQLNQQTIRARYKASGAISQGTSFSIVNFDTKDYDTHNAVTVGAGWQFEVPRDGFYLIKSQLVPDSAAGDANQDLGIYIDGTREVQSDNIIQSNGNDTIYVDASLKLKKGQLINIRSNNTSSSPTVNDPIRNYVEISSLPDFTTYGVVKGKNKIQTKTLSADVTSDGTISDLTFSNLTVGNWYEVKGSYRFVTDDTVADPGVQVSANHDSATIDVKIFNINETVDTSIDTLVATPNFIFQATATTITFVASGATANSYIQGNGTRSETYIQLEERNDLIETTEF